MLNTPIFLIALLLPLADAGDDDVGIRAPDGFEVSLYADDELAHDIYSMTIDAQGRVVVAGRGYVKTLHDRDGDGRADEATLFSPLPGSGAHGMVFDGNNLVCTGDNSLLRLRDPDGDGRADGEPEVWAQLGHSEHGANGVIQGPDGWFYVICGNDAGLTAELAHGGSPVTEPQCGGVVRFSPDGSHSEIIAHGMRNPYDLGFNRFGHIFTVDADGERDQYLPWYSPTRLYDVAQGMHHGWVLKGWQRSWNRPAWFPDNVERLDEIGRGSPTGLTVYRHRQFPEHYRGGVMSCCWTLGRVYYFPLSHSGSSYTTDHEIFLETTGEVGFAPVDLAVGPTGDLFVAIGGRRTRGSVFRVRYQGGNATEDESNNELTAVLAADQPLAAWSRARWRPAALEIGERAFEDACCDAELPVDQRVRSVEVLTDLFDGISAGVAVRALESDNAQLAARIAWSLGRRPQGDGRAEMLAILTWHEDRRVARAAWESLQTLPAPVVRSLKANWSDIADRSDNRLRFAALLAEAAARTDFKAIPEITNRSDVVTMLWQSYYRGDFDDNPLGYARAIEHPVDSQSLETVRLIQLSLGDILAQSTTPDVLAGYRLNGDAEFIAAARESVGSDLAASFPTGNRHVDLELARLLGMLAVNDSDLATRMADRWSHDTSPQDDIHYLIVLAQLPAPRDEQATKRIADALVHLSLKMDHLGQHPSRNWPLRVGETFEQLCRHDPALRQAVTDHPQYGAAPHALFVNRMPAEHQAEAARRLIAERRLAAALQGSDDDIWTAEVIRVAEFLPADDALPLARELWSNFQWRDALVPLLAHQPAAEDRDRFSEALASTDPSTVELAARALLSLPDSGEPSDLLAVMKALRQSCLAPEQNSQRTALVQLLSQWTGQQIEVDEQEGSDLLAAYGAWFAWFAADHPDAADELASFGGADAAAWRERLAAIDWSLGDSARGKVTFQRRACHRCHAAGSRLGPDLAGSAVRLSRDDLWAAIVDPNREVAPLYQTTQVVTAAGKTYHGLLVYESPDGTLIQTGPDETVRIAGDEIVSLRKTNRSLMPVGLLNGIDDMALADLFAYMNSLRETQ